jgi:hypothetical protein
MQQRKLLRLLVSFSTDDFHKFQLFVHSPFFNTNQNVTLLLQYLIPHAPLFEDTGLSETEAYRFVFGQPAAEVNSKEVITKLASKLTQLAVQYVEYKALQNEPFWTAYFRKKYFRKKKYAEWETEALQDMEDVQQNLPHSDAFYALYAFLLEQERVALHLANHTIVEKVDFSNLNKRLDEYYLCEKIKNLCQSLNLSIVMNRPDTSPETEIVASLVSLRRNDLSQYTLLWLEALYMLQNTDNSHHFQSFKQTLIAQESLLSILEKRTFFLYLSNVARVVFSDTEAYFSELYALYQLQVAQKTIFVDGVILPETLFNMISVAIRMDDVSWARAFINEHRDDLDPNNEKSPAMLALCDGILAFEVGEYEQALEYLNKTNFKDIQSKLTERRIRLKVYLELGYDSLFFDQINAFRKFLSVNKSIIPSHHREGNRLFINASLIVYKIQTQPESARRQLQKMIQEAAVLPEKHWLQKKGKKNG